MLVLVVVEALFTVVTVVLRRSARRKKRKRKRRRRGVSLKSVVQHSGISPTFTLHISILSVKFNSVLFSLARDN